MCLLDLKAEYKPEFILMFCFKEEVLYSDEKKNSILYNRKLSIRARDNLINCLREIVFVEYIN